MLFKTRVTIANDCADCFEILNNYIDHSVLAVESIKATLKFSQSEYHQPKYIQNLSSEKIENYFFTDLAIE